MGKLVPPLLTLKHPFPGLRKQGYNGLEPHENLKALETACRNLIRYSNNVHMDGMDCLDDEIMWDV